MNAEARRGLGKWVTDWEIQAFRKYVQESSASKRQSGAGTECLNEYRKQEETTFMSL